MVSVVDCKCDCCYLGMMRGASLQKQVGRGPWVQCACVCCKLHMVCVLVCNCCRLWMMRGASQLKQVG